MVFNISLTLVLFIYASILVYLTELHFPIYFLKFMYVFGYKICEGLTPLFCFK